MSRSPLAYPLTRGIDGDSGGAADLQTDIMRFMAILALCLVAIFALVQSIPLTPESRPQPIAAFEPATDVPSEMVDASVEPSTPSPNVETTLTRPTAPATPKPGPSPHLTRPKWVPRPQMARAKSEDPATPKPAAVEHVAEQAPAPPIPETKSEPEGFTLRFASDVALTRLVAAGQVGFYAIDTGRARRMSVRDSRISFWDASTPASFHEMESQTVPRHVIDALARTGVNTNRVNWGVTLPGRLQRQLDTLLREHRGGKLVIHPDGQVRLEAS